MNSLPISAAWLTLALASPSTLAQSSHPAETDLAKDGGPGQFAELTAPDDGVPRPRARRFATDERGDRVLASSAGDPYVLAFVAGSYAPPEGERLDPLLIAQLADARDDGRAAQEVYAMAMLSQRVREERLEQLRALGCRVQGLHPHYALKLAVPVAALDAVAALDFVRWLGVPRAEQKVHPRLLEELGRVPAGEPVEVWINVYESDLGADSTFSLAGAQRTAAPSGVLESEPGQRLGGEVWQSNGWQQRALERRGVEVLEYVDRVRAFRARILPGALESLVALDFVLFVEFAPPHEERRPEQHAQQWQ